MKNTGFKLIAGTAGLLIGRAIYKKATMESLEGKVVLITGGSRGLGLELARQLAAKGAKVAVCARDKDELNRAIANLRREGSEVSAHLCDVSNKSDVEMMVKEITSEWGRIDVLINNAGVMLVGPVDLMDAKQYEEALQNNLWGAINTTLAVLPHMQQRRKGNIVNITSVGGKVAIPHLLPYSVSKFAMVGFSEGLHAELKKHNIKVTTVCPGLMRTGSHYNIDVMGKKKEEFGWFSLTGTNPLISVSAKRAASSIIKAFREGRTEKVISVPAAILIKMQGMFPALTSDISGLVNYLLPDSEGEKGYKEKGYENTSAYSPSVLTHLGDKAARENNEIEENQLK